MSSRSLSRLSTRDRAVMLKICLGAKLTPSFTWKWNPPNMVPLERKNFCPNFRSCLCSRFKVCDNYYRLTSALTAVYKHQLMAVDVSLGKVQDWSRGGALQGKVSITGGSDDKLQALRVRVTVRSTEVIAGDFSDGVHPYL